MYRSGGAWVRNAEQPESDLEAKALLALWRHAAGGRRHQGVRVLVDCAASFKVRVLGLPHAPHLLWRQLVRLLGSHLQALQTFKPPTWLIVSQTDKKCHGHA